MSTQRYGLAPGVQWRHWAEEDEAVVYVEARFETHLLGEASVFLLETLASMGQPVNEQDLMRALFGDESERDPSMASPQDVQVHLQALIQHLLSLGVIVEQAC